MITLRSRVTDVMVIKSAVEAVRTIKTIAVVTMSVILLATETMLAGCLKPM